LQTNADMIALQKSDIPFTGDNDKSNTTLLMSSRPNWVPKSYWKSGHSHTDYNLLCNLLFYATECKCAQYILSSWVCNWPCL